MRAPLAPRGDRCIRRQVAQSGRMIAWKMVDLCHAAAFSQGILRLGTFASYRDLENGRADSLDGAMAVKAQPGGDSFGPIAREAFGLADMLRFHVDIVAASEPVWVFCMTVPGCTHDLTPDVPKAVFEIHGVRTLCDQLGPQLAGFCAGFEIHRVTYMQRQFDTLAAFETTNADPFIKDTAYEAEREIRAIFMPGEGVTVDASIFTQPDPVIASLLRRVR